MSGQQDYSLAEDENFAGIIGINKSIYIKPRTDALDDEYVEIEKIGREWSNSDGVPTAYRISKKVLYLILFLITLQQMVSKSF